MKTKLLALILGAAFLAGPALAATVMSNDAHMFKARGRMVEVHQMKMDDGTMVYAMSKSDLERVLNQKIRDFSTYAPQR
jgi:hypothetical protein